MNKETPPNEAAERGHSYTDQDAERSNHRVGEMSRRGFVRTGVTALRRAWRAPNSPARPGRRTRTAKARATETTRAKAEKAGAMS